MVDKIESRLKVEIVIFRDDSVSTTADERIAVLQLFLDMMEKLKRKDLLEGQYVSFLECEESIY